MSRHTPGPWTLDERNVCIQDGASEEFGPFIVYAGKADDPITLAIIDDDGEPGVAMADARLIAAAPELLAALKNAGRVLEAVADRTGHMLKIDELENRGAWGEDLQVMQQVFSETIAAIAKAEGR